jgi:hypothetical protein
MITTKELDAAYGFGQDVALALGGLTHREGVRMKSAVSQLDARTNPKARVFEQQVIKMAALMMKESGNMDTVSFHVADTITKSATTYWPSQFSEFAGMVLQAMGREAARYKQASEGDVLSGEEVKAASTKWLLSLLGRGALMTPEILKGLLGVSALTGGAAGGLAWKLNRDTAEDEAELEGMKAKINAYDRISNDVEQTLKDRMAT